MSLTTCSRCILDEKDDPDIQPDAEGICQHCHHHDAMVERFTFSEEERPVHLQQLLANIKEAGKGKEYDCIIGVSGGVDSTYVAYLTKEMGLRPLAVHLDNGWNSELAVKNIENILKQLHIDLYTHVIDWEEFKDIQLSYFKAGVIDLEVPTDNAILGALYKVARRHKVKHIISGYSTATEGFLPKHWVFNKLDMRNFKAIHKQFGSVKRHTFPAIDMFRLHASMRMKRIELVSLLDFVAYNKPEAKETITRKLGWRDYGGKHYESIFTRFYQAYILPKRFGVDKRKSHLSSLIRCNQLSREAALEEMQLSPYNDNFELEAEDKAYVIKKLGFTEASFAAYMQSPIHAHCDYPCYDTMRFNLWSLMLKMNKLRKKIWKRN